MTGVAVRARGAGPARAGRTAFGFRLPPAIVGLAAGLILWEVGGRVANVQFLPPLSRVIQRLGELIESGVIVANLTMTVTNLLIGFAISLVFGLAIGVLMGMSRRARLALDVYVYALMTAPAIVFAPIYFAIFGLGRASIIGLIVQYAIFIIIVQTAAAVRASPSALLEMGRVFGASKRQLLRDVVFPAAVPLIMAGVRLGIGRAVIGAINGEMFIAIVGLGLVVRQAGAVYDAAAVFAVLLVVITVALVAVAVVQYFDRRLTAWLPPTGRAGRVGARQ